MVRFLEQQCQLFWLIIFLFDVNHASSKKNASFNVFILFNTKPVTQIVLSLV